MFCWFSGFAATNNATMTILVWIKMDSEKWLVSLIGTHILNFNRCWQIFLPKMCQFRFPPMLCESFRFTSRSGLCASSWIKVWSPNLRVHWDPKGWSLGSSGPWAPLRIMWVDKLSVGKDEPRLGSVYPPMSQLVNQVTQPSSKKRQGYFGREWAPHH